MWVVTFRLGSFKFQKISENSEIVIIRSKCKIYLYSRHYPHLPGLTHLLQPQVRPPTSKNFQLTNLSVISSDGWQIRDITDMSTICQMEQSKKCQSKKKSQNRGPRTKSDRCIKEFSEYLFCSFIHHLFIYLYMFLRLSNKV